MTDQREYVREKDEYVFETLAKEWLEAHCIQLKDSSIVKYNNLLTGYLLPYFGKKSLENISQEEIVDFSKRLLLTGGKDGRGISAKTIVDTVSVLKSILKYAEQYKNIKVVSVNKLPIRQSLKPMRILTVSEQQKLSNYLCQDLTLTNLGILVCLYTGVRIGELCALKWGDIFWEEQYVYINKTLQRIQNRNGESPKTVISVSSPKSECSIRKIPLPNGIFQLMQAKRQPFDTYFLTGLSDKYVEPKTLQNRFKATIKKCNIEDANFHALRHTFATRCMEIGFDAKCLSEILGHSSVTITLNRYVHPSMALKQKNMDMLSAQLQIMK